MLIIFLWCISFIYKRSSLELRSFFIFSTQIQLFKRFANSVIGLSRRIVWTGDWILFPISLREIAQKGSSLRFKTNLSMTVRHLLTIWRWLFGAAVLLWWNLNVRSNLFNWFFVGLSAQRLNIFFGGLFSLEQLLLLTFVAANHNGTTVDPLANHLIRWQLYVALATLIHVLAHARIHNLWCQEFVVDWRARILWFLVFFNFTKMRTFLTIHGFNLSNERLFLILFQMWTCALLIGLLAIFVNFVLKVFLQSFLNCRLISIHLFVVIQGNLS